MLATEIWIVLKKPASVKRIYENATIQIETDAKISLVFTCDKHMLIIIST